MQLSSVGLPALPKNTRYRGQSSGRRRENGTSLNCAQQSRNHGEEKGTSEGNLVALECSPNSNVASRPVLQRRPRNLRTPHPAEPCCAGRGARRFGRAPAALEDGPRRVSRRRRGHVARGSVAVKSWGLPPGSANTTPSDSVRKLPQDAAGPAPKMKRPWVQAQGPLSSDWPRFLSSVLVP